MADLRVQLPDCFVRDFTNLELDRSFACEVTLVKPSEWRMDDVALAVARGGSLCFIYGFASIVHPYCYVHAVNMHVTASGTLEFSDGLTDGANRDLASDVVAVVRSRIQDEGFEALTYEEVSHVFKQQIPTGEIVTFSVFNCLFSDVLSP